MADINARTRLLVGTAANWAASDLVLGDGEVVLERAGTAVKMKAGNGTAKYSALPFLSMQPVIPPEYLTDSEADAAYLKLADVSTASAANKVPRMGPTGMLATAMIPLPPAIDQSTGVADAGKLVKTSSTGKIDPSMITVITGGYRGLTDATLAVPAGTYVPGDYFINTGSGAAHASWGLPGGTQVGPSQQLVWDGVKWGIVGAVGGSLVRLADGTVSSPSLTFGADPLTGWYRSGANQWAFGVTGTQVATLSSEGLKLGGSDLTASIGVRTGLGWGGALVPSPNMNALVIDSDSNEGITILTPNTAFGTLAFGDPDSTSSGYLRYNHALDAFTLVTAGTTRMTLSATQMLMTVPINATSGTVTDPGVSLGGNQGLFRVGPTNMGVALNALEVARFQFSATNDARFLVGIQGAQIAGTGRGLMEINGATTAYLGLDVAGANIGSIGADANSIIVAAAGTKPVTFTTNGTERGRFTGSATDRFEFLMGRTAPLSGTANRALIELDGATTAYLGLDVAAANIGFIGVDASSLTVAAVGTKPVIFSTNGTERGRFTGSATDRFEFLMGRTAPLSGTANRALIELDGGTDSFISLDAAGARVGYVQAAAASMNLGTFTAVPIQFKPNGTTSFSMNADGSVTYGGVEVGYRGVPNNIQAGAYTLADTDRGRCVVKTGAGTVNIPAGGVFNAGDVVSLCNKMASTSFVLHALSGATMNWGTGAGGILTTDRTIAPGGLVTLLFTSANNCVLTGSGIS